MIGKSAVVASLMLVGASLATPASAGQLSVAFDRPHGGAVVETGASWRQGHNDGYGWRHWTSPREVRRILRRAGFHEIRHVESQGRSYVARALDYRDRPVIVRVSARSGEILTVRRVHRRDEEQCWLPEGCEDYGY